MASRKRKQQINETSEKVLWALVQFKEDGIFFATQLPKQKNKNCTHKKGTTINCRWKDGGKYPAEIIELGDEETIKKSYLDKNTTPHHTPSKNTCTENISQHSKHSDLKCIIPTKNNFCNEVFSLGINKNISEMVETSAMHLTRAMYDDTQAMEETPIMEKSKALEDNSTVQETVTAKESLAIQVTPIMQESQAVEYNSETQVIPIIQEHQTMQKIPAMQITPIMEESQSMEDNSETQAIPVIREHQTAQKIQAMQVTPIIQESQAVEDNLAMQVIPVIQEHQAVHKIPAMQITPIMQEPQSMEGNSETQVIPVIQEHQTVQKIQAMQVTPIMQESQAVEDNSAIQVIPVIQEHQTTQKIQAMQITPINQEPQSMEDNSEMQVIPVIQEHHSVQKIPTMQVTPAIKETEIREKTITDQTDNIPFICKPQSNNRNFNVENIFENFDSLNSSLSSNYDDSDIDPNYLPSDADSDSDFLKQTNKSKPLFDSDCIEGSCGEELSNDSIEINLLQAITYTKNKSSASLSEENTHDSEITVQVSKNTKTRRVWDRKQFCVYCEKPFSKLPKHLIARHSDEKDVLQLLSLPKNSKERRNQILKIRNAGNYQHNNKVLQTGTGEIVPYKRPTSLKDYNKYYPCEDCLGFFIKEDLWRHSINCKQKKEQKNSSGGRKRRQCFSAALIPMPSTCSQGLRENVISHMNSDEITLVAKNDDLILAYGSRLYMKHGSEPHLTSYISQKMREVSRFLLEARTVNKLIKSLKDCINVQRFPDILIAVKKLAGFNEETGSWAKPTLALKIGHALNMCATLIKGEALINGNDLEQKQAEDFKRIYEMNWKVEISCHALKTMSRNKWNKLQVLPLNEDINKVNCFLKSELQKGIKKVKDDPCKVAWEKLAKITLAVIILFNRRRGGEAARLEIETYKNRDKRGVQTDLINSLSKFEQHLANSLTVVETRGKKGRKVVILLNKEMKDGIELLIAHRSVAGVANANKYVFARSNFDSLESLRGSDVLREVVKECAVKEPENLTSTRLRKHIATMSQLFNLKDNELDNLANFLGHDIAVHREFYRLPENLLIMTKVGKLLMAADEGILHKFKGKSLEEIEIDDTWNDKDYVNEDFLTDDEDSDMESSSQSRNVRSKCDRSLLKEKFVSINNSENSYVSSKKSTDKDNKNKKKKSTDKENKKNSTDSTLEKDPKKRNMDGRRAWSTDEKNAIYQFLPMDRLLALKTLPGKKECTECLQKAGDLLKNRSWQQVKFFVYNLLQKKH